MRTLAALFALVGFFTQATRAVADPPCEFRRLAQARATALGNAPPVNPKLLPKGSTEITELSDGSYRVETIDRMPGGAKERAYIVFRPDSKSGYALTYYNADGAPTGKGHSAGPPLSWERTTLERIQKRQAEQMEALGSAALRRLITDSVAGFGLTPADLDKSRKTVQQRNPTLDENALEVLASGHVVATSAHAEKAVRDAIATMGYDRPTVEAKLRGTEQNEETLYCAEQQRLFELSGGLAVMRRNGFEAEADAVAEALIKALYQ
jgi:hypothetical protein